MTTPETIDAASVLAMREPLQELVALKDLKEGAPYEEFPGYADYRTRQPLAWAAARAALAALPEPRAGERGALVGKALTDDECFQMARKHVVMNGSHEMPDYVAIVREALALGGELEYRAALAASPIGTPKPQEHESKISDSRIDKLADEHLNTARIEGLLECDYTPRIRAFARAVLQEGHEPDLHGTLEQRRAYWMARCPQCGLSRTDDPGCQCKLGIIPQDGDRGTGGN